MAYPEKDAGYVHKPKFLERMAKEEGEGSEFTAGSLSGEGRLQKMRHEEARHNRAEGGGVQPIDPGKPELQGPSDRYGIPPGGSRTSMTDWLVKNPSAIKPVVGAMKPKKD